ncbi:unnamed protein product [Phaeothamnion confervicola]
MAFGIAPQRRADFTLPSPPSDTVSDLAFSPNAQFLVAGSWDNGVRCWELQRQSATEGVVNAAPKAQINHEAPVLSVDFSADGSVVFSGGCDKVLKMWNLGQAGHQGQNIGQHDAPIRHVQFLPEPQLVATGSWDKTVRFWDARQPNPAAQIQLEDKVYAMDAVFPLLVVGLGDANRTMAVYDMSQGQPRLHAKKQSQLKYQTRCVACLPDKTGFAVGSIEGRVGIEYVNEMVPEHQTPPTNKRGFAFKCHRDQPAGKGATVYAVNAIAMHRYGTFATGGSDGSFNFWDKDSRQRLKAFDKRDNAITCARFSAAGDLFAYGIGYDWSRGCEHAPPPGQAHSNIFVHHATDEEIKPREKAGDKK